MQSAHVILAATLALTGGFTGAVEAQANEQAGNPLLAERWQTRPLIVIAPNPRDATYLQLREALQIPANREAFIDREMVLYTVIEGVGSRNDEPLAASATAALLKAIDVRADSSAQVILVGKDGGKKIQRTGQVDPAEVFAIIDRMPMRQAR